VGAAQAERVAFRAAGAQAGVTSATVGTQTEIEEVRFRTVGTQTEETLAEVACGCRPRRPDRRN